MSETLTPFLTVRNLSLSFGGLKALQDFHLSLPARGLHGLIGPNGAGKTTAFNVLTGIYQPDCGVIKLGDRVLHGLKPYQVTRAGLGRTFQNIRLFGNLSVLDNVRMGFHLRSRETLWSSVLRLPSFRNDEAAVERRAMALLEIFRLENRAQEMAKNLPYGDQRCLEIARALATSPQVLLLDEPAAGMNANEKKQLASLIQTLRRQFQVAILLIEHDMGLVMEICEHITVLDHGEVISEGTPQVVQNDQKVIEAYLGQEARP